MKQCCRKTKHCFHSSQTASQCIRLMRIRHTSASFSCSLNLAISLSSVCIPAPLSLFVSYTCTQRRRCAALWQQLVSSVNDLWRVSRCVSLGSFRFVSTELYLRAPFMCPQVWLPSPLRRGGGGVAKFPHSPCGGQRWKAHERDGALLNCRAQGA